MRRRFGNDLYATPGEIIVAFCRTDRDPNECFVVLHETSGAWDGLSMQFNNWYAVPA